MAATKNTARVTAMDCLKSGSPRAFWLTAVTGEMMGQDRIESRDLCYWRNYNMVIMFLQILEQPKAQQAHTLQLNYFFRSPQ